MPSDKFCHKALITAVAHDWPATLTKARQQTNAPNTHTLSLLTGAWFMVWVFAELSFEIGFYNVDPKLIHLLSQGQENWPRGVIFAE